ncbi:MAG: hypothetical protein ACLFPW_12335 [Spirochaetaceae bacterium]
MTPTRITVALFVAERYWADANERDAAIATARAVIGKLLSPLGLSEGEVQAVTVQELADLEQIQGPGGLAILVPMSGAVQPWMEEAAASFEALYIVPGYMEAIFPRLVALRALELNSAPASMDLYAVLKRGELPVHLVRTPEELVARVRAWRGVQALRGSKLLMVGKPEPWVISVSRRYADYESTFGIELETVGHEQLKARFDAIERSAAEARAEEYLSSATELVEPTADAVIEASRLVLAVEELMEETGALGLAVACFNLISVLGTTSCLTVSMLNDSDRWIGACEGDLDSALTLMLVKTVTGKPGWIANPNLQRDETVNFVHCTAALRLGGSPHAYRLRSHHESGTGVSPEVELPTNEQVSLVRFGMKEGKLTIQRGRALTPAREPSCRTQLRVDLGEVDEYLNNVLGCHQVIVYGDVRKELSYAAELLGIEVTETGYQLSPA